MPIGQVFHYCKLFQIRKFLQLALIKLEDKMWFAPVPYVWARAMNHEYFLDSLYNNYNCQLTGFPSLLKSCRAIIVLSLFEFLSLFIIRGDFFCCRLSIIL